MQQVDRAQVPGHRHQRHRLGRLRQHHRAAHVHAVHHHPHVGGPVVHRSAAAGTADHMLPAPQVIGVADGVHRRLIRHSPRAKAQQVHAHPIHAVDGLPGRLVRIRHQRRGGVEHVPVECEAVLDRGFGAQVGQRRRRPVQYHWSAFGGRRHRCILLRAHRRHAAESQRQGKAKPQRLLHIHLNAAAQKSYGRRARENQLASAKPPVADPGPA